METFNEGRHLRSSYPLSATSLPDISTLLF